MTNTQQLLNSKQTPGAMKIWMITLILVHYSEAARILAFFPIVAKSHHYIFRPVMAALAKRGHEVVYYTGYPYEGTVPQGLVQVDLSEELPDLHAMLSLTDFVDKNVLEEMLSLFKFSISYIPFIVGCKKVQELIHSDEKFDVVLTQSFYLQEYLTAFVHKFNAIGIEIVSIGDNGWMNELAGLPDNPAYQIDFKADLTQNMDFWQRLYNTYVSAVTTIGGYYYMHQMEKIVDQYFNYTGWESRPPFMQLVCNRSLILVNYHYIIGYPAPLPPHRKDIGGVNIQPEKPLPEKIQTFMDTAASGVIYFSLGTNINVSNPANKKLVDTFMKVFEEVPQMVLMKWETVYEGKLPQNVHLEKWYPQQDVLAHKNCVLFITHGGYLSLVEAVHFGVPVIGVPFIVDQAKNFLFVEESGIGKMLRLKEISYDNVSKMVKEVLSNKTYKEEIMRRSKIFRDRPREPVDEAVYWIEHVIKYPNVLKPKAASLSYIQLNLIDVKLFIFSAISAIVFIMWKLMTIFVSFTKGKGTNSKEKRS